MIEAYFIGPFGGVSGPRALQRNEVQPCIEWAVNWDHISPIAPGEELDPFGGKIKRAVFRLVAHGEMALYKFQEVV